MVNGNKDFQLGERLGGIEKQITSVSDSIKELHSSLHDFKKGINENIQKHDSDIAVIKERQDTFSKVAGWIFAPAIGVVVTALFYLIIRK